MAKTKGTTSNAPTAKVEADKARVDRLKELIRSIPAEVDFEWARVMATLLERKEPYIDDNLFLGRMASAVNSIYTHPEWNVDWMKEEKTVEKSKVEPKII